MCHVALPQCHGDLKRSHSDPALAKVAEEEGEEGGTPEDEERRYPGMCVVSIQGCRHVGESGEDWDVVKCLYTDIWIFSPHVQQYYWIG